MSLAAGSLNSPFFPAFFVREFCFSKRVNCCKKFPTLSLRNFVAVMASRRQVKLIFFSVCLCCTAFPLFPALDFLDFLFFLLLALFSLFRFFCFDFLFFLLLFFLFLFFLDCLSLFF